MNYKYKIPASTWREIIRFKCTIISLIYSDLYLFDIYLKVYF